MRSAARISARPVERELVRAGGREVAITHPDKVLFPEAGYTKRDLVRYYLEVADGALRGSGGRPNMLVRYPDGIEGELFHQKRAPAPRPAWIDVVRRRFASGRSADEVVPRDAAALAWMANLACLELHPHPVRAGDLEHPDELRVDLDPVAGVKWAQVRRVALVTAEVLREFGLVGWPKTSGKRGIHVCVRIEPRWTHDEVRRAAVALALEIERRAPKLSATRWWKEEREGVFIDCDRNAQDRTVAGAYSVRPTDDARVSAPLSWEEVDACDPRDFTLATMPVRYRRVGDRHAAIDDHAGSLEGLLELARRKRISAAKPAPKSARRKPSSARKRS